MPEQLRPHGRREPGAEPVKDTQDSADYQPQHNLVHMLSLQASRPLNVLFNDLEISFKPRGWIFVQNSSEMQPLA